MTRWWLLAAAVVLAAWASPSQAYPSEPCLGSGCLPQQVHLSFDVMRADGKAVMVVTWNTLNETEGSVVQYGVDPRDMTQVGVAERSLFVGTGDLHLQQYVYRARMEPLVPGGTYAYRVGNDVSGWSAVYSFVAMRAAGSEDDPLRYVVYGDLGEANSRSLGQVQSELVDGRVDAVVHLGDAAYDLDSDNGRVGDAFMRDIQPVAATVPYMMSPGNHEQDSVNGTATFHNYISRFTMPGNTQNMYYSWNQGLVHWIMLSTEAYFYQSQRALIPQQFEWLLADLKQANAERHLRPWVVTVGHRPPYCSNADSDDCTMDYSIIRDGLLVNGTFLYGLEDALYEGGVDLAFWAHEHSYERLASGLYRHKVLPSKNPPYVDPLAPIHLIAGSAGCREIHNGFRNASDIAPWSAFRTTDYGYGTLEIFNATTMVWRQKNETGNVIDEITVSASTHGPFGPAVPRPVPAGMEEVDEFTFPALLDDAGPERQ